MRQHTFIRFACCTVWRGMSTCFITNKCISWTIMYTELKCKVKQWNKSVAVCKGKIWHYALISASFACGFTFSCGVSIRFRVMAYPYGDSRSYSDTPHSVGLFWTQRSLPDNTQHSKEQNIHGPAGTRTRNPSKTAAADPRLSLRGHWDRPVDE
jgi:hypothetical protein